MPGLGRVLHGRRPPVIDRLWSSPGAPVDEIVATQPTDGIAAPLAGIGQADSLFVDFQPVSAGIHDGTDGSHNQRDRLAASPLADALRETSDMPTKTFTGGRIKKAVQHRIATAGPALGQ